MRVQLYATHIDRVLAQYSLNKDRRYLNANWVAEPYPTSGHVPSFTKMFAQKSLFLVHSGTDCKLYYGLALQYLL